MGLQSQDHTFIKDDGQQVDQTDQYIDDMKKGTSNILVTILAYLLVIGRCETKAALGQGETRGAVRDRHSGLRLVDGGVLAATFRL